MATTNWIRICFKLAWVKALQPTDNELIEFKPPCKSPIFWGGKSKVFSRWKSYLLVEFCFEILEHQQPQGFSKVKTKNLVNPSGFFEVQVRRAFASKFLDKALIFKKLQQLYSRQLKGEKICLSNTNRQPALKSASLRQSHRLVCWFQKQYLDKWLWRRIRRFLQPERKR